MIIFRVEDSEGRGVYRRLINKCREDEGYFGNFSGIGSDKHPCPYFEKKSFRKKWQSLWKVNEQVHWYFGFKTMDQLLEWFYCPAFRKVMFYHGAKLALYETDGRKIMKGRSQIAFDKRKSKLIKYISLPV